jgi:hypothetical protein
LISFGFEFPGGRAMGRNPNQPLTGLARFIDKYYLKQKNWVQGTTFIVFVVLFAYGYINQLTGYYALKGDAYVQSPSGCATGPGSCSSYAKYYDVRWGTQEFATNSKGEYYITIRFPEYLALLAEASHELTFIKDDRVVAANQPVAFSRWGGEFADVILPPSTVPESSPASDRTGIIATVWADTLPGDYRLLVQGIRLSGWPLKAQASMRLFVGDAVMTLQDHSRGDRQVGDIPIVRDQNLDLGSSYYFAIPGLKSNSLSGGRISLTAPGSFFQFSNLDEQFVLPAQQALGRSLKITGSRGSVIAVRLVLRSDVTVFDKSDLYGKKEQVETDLLNQGLLARWTSSPQGFMPETNALWTGTAVPFGVIQKLITVALNQNIELKKVEYQYSFATPNAEGIQLGYSAMCAKTPVIPRSVLQDASAAHTEAEFENFLTPFRSCTVASAKPPRRR